MVYTCHSRACGNTFFDPRYETTQHDNKKNVLIHSNNNWFLEFHVAVILLRQKQYKTINSLFCVVFIYMKNDKKQEIYCLILSIKQHNPINLLCEMINLLFETINLPSETINIDTTQ